MEQVNSLEVLREAMHIEKEGIRFYRRAAKGSKNRKTQDLFLRLAREELLHLEKLELVYDNLAENSEWLVDLDLSENEPKVLKDIEIFDADVEVEEELDEFSALDRGIRAEEDSIRLYKKASEDFKGIRGGGHAIFTWLLAFEHEHLKSLRERRKELVY